MAKGARASVRKTNNKALKSRVFGPAEDARTQRLSAKLLELASQPKPPRAEMDVEKNENKEEDEAESKETQHADDTEMDVDGAKKDAKADPNSFNSYKKAKKEKHDKIDAKKRRKTTNTMTFKNKVTKNKKGGRK